MLKPRAVLTTAAALLFLGAAPASAASIKVDDGATALTVSPAAANALGDAGISLRVLKPAVARTRNAVFPVTAGRIDPQTSAGRLVHSGGIRISAGGTKLRLTDFVVKIGRSSSLSAKVNGGDRLKVFELDPTDAEFTREGLVNTIGDVDVLLTRRGARALNQTFSTDLFFRYLKLGTVQVAAEHAEIVFGAGRTDLALDPSAAAALKSLGITPGLVDPAAANDDGTFGFPITGGRVNATSLAGRVRHAGGITLTRGGVQVSLTDFSINTVRGTLSARVNGSEDVVGILALDLSNPSVDIDGTAVTVGNVGATLTGAAAAALNQAFGVTAFTPGQAFGRATVRGEAL